MQECCACCGRNFSIAVELRTSAVSRNYKNRPMFQTQIQSYINNFRRHIVAALKPGLGMSCKVYPAESGGAILEFQFGPSIQSEDTYMPAVQSLGAALMQTTQTSLRGDMTRANFHGTNTVLERNMVWLIKDNASKEWTDEAAAKDSAKILNLSRVGS